MKIILNLTVAIIIVLITSACGDKTPPKIVKEPITLDVMVIGTQTWMTLNLDLATFRNGDTIPEAKTAEEWKEAGKNKQAAWCYYDNDPKNGAKYGKLYNWYAVNDPRGLAPSGWHVSADQEWTVLSTFLGGEEVAGEKIKNSSGWNDYGCKKCNGGSAEIKNICSTCKGTQANSSEPFSGNGTNSSGFSGLPGGFRYRSGLFYAVGSFGCWWSASGATETGACNRYLGSYGSDLSRYGSKYEEFGFSVRCVKD